MAQTGGNGRARSRTSARERRSSRDRSGQPSAHRCETSDAQGAEHMLQLLAADVLGATEGDAPSRAQVMPTAGPSAITSVGDTPTTSART